MLPYTKIDSFLDSLELSTVKDNKKVTYINIESAFDIETTSIKNMGVKHAFMYVWMVGIGYGNEVFYGRYWHEFVDLCEKLSKRYELNNEKRLVIYIHNLGYEFQFMRKYFNWESVFSVDERKPIKALTDLGIEFRCSYILSGYSLENTAKNLAIHKVKKMTGDLDYSLIRTAETELTDLEVGYCENDINVVNAYINEQIKLSGDISKIPMTNTGRVRTYVRNNCYYKKEDGSKAGKGQYTRYRSIMNDLTLDPETYNQLKRAFMGGFTHANAQYSGKLLHDVSSVDFTSSYPSVMLSEKFPMSRYRSIPENDMINFKKYCQKHSVIFNAKFINIRSKITQENYISESKCYELIKPILNNGRIYSAELLTITLTEIDLDIISQCYEWDELSILNAKYAHTAYLPKPIIMSILKLYQDKTVLKDVQGSEVEYLLSKGMLNSIYGMCVTDVMKDNVIYSDDWGTEKIDTADELLKHNESKNRFLYYAWGIYVTAYARRNLWTGILAVGDDYVYSDTDSLKILNYENHKPYIKWFDSQILSKMEKMCDEYNIDKKLLSPKTKKGVIKTMGVWDFEGTYQNFKTLGAKRYLTDLNGKLQLTVAGLSKQNGLNYMLEQCNNDVLKVFEMFNDDLYVPEDKTGKMTHTYLDNEGTIKVTDYLGNNTIVNYLSGIHLENAEYTLSISKNYTDFMYNLSNGYIYKGVKHI